MFFGKKTMSTRVAEWQTAACLGISTEHFSFQLNSGYRIDDGSHYDLPVCSAT